MTTFSHHITILNDTQIIKFAYFTILLTYNENITYILHFCLYSHTKLITHLNYEKTNGLFSLVLYK